MNRAGVLLIVLAAAVTGACGGSESASPAPTGPTSTTTTTTAPPPPPPQQACVPTNLRVASQQGSVVTLEWNGVSGATEYVVLVGSTPGSSDQLSTNTTNTSYTWTAKSGRQYARVQAKCNGQFGSSSNEVEYTVGS
jgi:hypothetical protein